MKCSFVVQARPAPVGSKKLVPGGPRPAPGEADTRKQFLVESSKKAGPWRTKVRRAAKAAWGGWPPMSGAVKVTLRFYFARPSSHLGTVGLNADAPLYPITEADIDKLVRGVHDEMSERVYADDRLVCALRTTKEYGSPERCEVTVEELEG